MSHLDVGLMHELLDGEVPSSELAPIQAHLASCAECRAKFEEERQLLAGTDELIELLEVPAAETVRDEPSVVPRRRIAWVRDLAWAASIVLAVGVGYAVRGTPRNEAVVPTAAGASAANAAPVTPPPAEPPVMHDAFRPVQPANQPAEAAARPATPPPAALEPTNRLAARRLDSSTALDAAAKVASAERRTADSVRPVTGVGADSGTRKQNASAPVGDLYRMASGTGAVTRPLYQVVTRGRGAGGGRGGAPGLAAVRAAPIDSISLPDAMRRLGGTLRLIDGLVPVRLEFQEPWIRVVYPGDIVLQQQLIDGHVVATVIGPRGFRADSLARLQAKVRE